MKTSRVRIGACVACSYFLLATSLLANGASLQIYGVPSDVTVFCGQVPPSPLVTATSSCFAGAAPTNGLVLYYSFDSHSGSNVIDQSGAGNTGVVHGTVTWQTNGHPGTGAAMHFSGDGSAYINAGTGAVLNMTSAFSLSAWIKPSSNWLDVRGIVGKGVQPSSVEYGLMWYNGKAAYRTTVTEETLWSDSSAAPLGAWTHVVGTLDAGGQARLYINGQLYTNGAMSMPQLLGGFRPMYVGRWRSGYDFSGMIDEVRVYNRALDSNEVALLTVPTAGSNSAVPVVFSAVTNGSCPGTITRTWTATDGCGNSTSATQVITLLPAPPPILLGVPSNITVSCGAVPPPVLVTATGTCRAAAAPTNGLVLYYSFDSDTGTNIVDHSGNGNGGQAHGPAFSIHGWRGGAYLWDGIGTDYIKVGRSGSLNVGGKLTVAAWIKVPDYAGTVSGRPFLEWCDASLAPLPGPATGGTHLWTGCTAIQWGSEGVGANLYTSNNVSHIINTTTPPVNEWHHVVVTYDNSSGKSRVYLDGILKKEKSDGSFLPNTLDDVVLGARLLEPHNPYKGMLDEVRIYNRALTSNEVFALTTSILLPVTITETTNGVCPRVISRVWTATDDCGGSVSATQTITVVDNTAPVLVGVPADTNAFCGEPLPAIPAVTAVDDCDNVPVVFAAVTNGGCPGAITRTWTATDACGNSNSATQVITLQPAPPPILLGVPSNITVSCGAVPPPALVTATGTCRAAAVPTNGLVLYYSFDSDTGTNIVDHSGNGNGGQAHGPAFSIHGWRGGAYLWDGIGTDYIKAGRSASLNVGGKLTISAWIKIPDYAGTVSGMPVLEWADGSLAPLPGPATGGVHLWSGCTALQWGSEGLGANLYTSNEVSHVINTTTPPINEWHHVAVTYDAVNGRARVYLDGVLKKEKNEGTFLPNTLDDIMLGARLLEPHNPFKGMMDEVRIYDRALASNEVVALTTSVLLPVTMIETTNGTCPQVISRVWTATDDCGGSVSATQTITVVDTAAPILVGVPADTIAFCGEPPPAVPAVTAVDDCDSVPVIFAAVTNGSCPGTITRSWMATDGCGNSTSAMQVITIMALHEVASDFDGDGLTDITTYWPGGGQWYALKSSGPGYQTLQLGSSNMVPVAADYDGDGWTDYAVYHAAAGAWHIRQSSTSSVVTRTWGYHAALAVPADYDGDGKADLATYVPESGGWYILQSASNRMRVVQWGWVQAMPVPADYDGDGKSDIATYVPANGTWYILKSGGGTAVRQWGWSQAMPVPADYDGDGKVDIATYVPANGTWYIIRSGGGVTIQQWGWSQAAPVPGDYDGDGKADIATYQPSSGTWYILKSTGGYRQVPWGWSEAVPVMPQFQLNRRYFPSP